jgi:hypothetical protein
MRRETIKREGGKHVLDAFRLVGISRNNRNPNGRGDFRIIFTWGKIYVSPRSHYLGVVVGLAWSYAAESYAGGSVATGSISLAGEI